MSHCNRHPLAEITPSTISECLYFVVRHYMIALYQPYIFIALA